jgi:predicted acylesterase/phospholipase RssA
MGITIIQKGDLTKVKRNGVKALILAGGAVTGGSFKAGGIKALNDYFTNFSVNDFDIYVGMSSGSLIAAPLIGGISPETILKSLDGTSTRFAPLGARHYYKPNFEELILRPLGFLSKLAIMLPGKLLSMAERYPDWSGGLLKNVAAFMKRPSLDSYHAIVDPIFKRIGGERMPHLSELLPSGIFDNSGIEAYIRKNIEDNGLLNDFKAIQKVSGKRLYISAMRLDGARRVIFGPDEDSTLTLSQAIQASTAMPGFYRPARINGIDYVDGGVQQTANMDVAAEKGAELIVCYNPFRPYEPDEFVDRMNQRNEERHLAASGVFAVLNQIFRAFFHSRLRITLENFEKDESFSGDIILVEPRPDDEAFFTLNPFSLRNRVEAARLGFNSVRNSIDKRFDEISKIMHSYGINMSKRGVDGVFEVLSSKSGDDAEVQSLLEGREKKPVARGRARVKRVVRKIKKVKTRVKRR